MLSVLLSCAGTLGLILAVLQYYEIGVSFLFSGDASFGLFAYVGYVLLFAAVFVCLFIAVRHLQLDDCRGIVVAAVFAFVLAFSIVAGCQLDQDGAFHDFASLLFRILLLACAFAPLLLVAFQALESTAASGHDSRPDRGNERSNSELRRVCLWCIIVLALVWLFWYLVFYPGIYGYDGWIWFLEYASEDVAITSQYSVPYSWLFYRFISFGRNVLGSDDYGFALFSALQMLLVFYAAARIIAFLGKRHRKYCPQILATTFFALVPTIPMLSVSSAQDAPFMAFFGLIVLHLIDMADEPSRYWKGIRKPVALFVIVVLFCLVRNNGVIIIAIMLPFVALYKKGLRKRLLFVLGLAMLAVCIYQGPLLGMLGVTNPVKLREMMSVPSQQIARVYTWDKDSLTPEEMAQIEYFYHTPQRDSAEMQVYLQQPCIADITKGLLDTERLSNSRSSFTSLYLKLGLEHPVAYTEAALLNSLGIWYPNISYPDTRMYHPYILSECVGKGTTYDSSYPNIDNLSVFPSIDSAIQYLFGLEEQHFSETPVLGTACKAGTYFFILLFVCGYTIYARRRRFALVLIPPIALVLTIFLGPVALCRYLLPLVFTAPLLLSILFNRTKTALLSTDSTHCY